MFIKKKKAIIVLIALMTMLTFLCLPVFGTTKDEKKPPGDKGQLPTVTGTINY
jgi:hypothetical protein